MLAKRVWVPIFLIALLAMIVYGLFYEQKKRTPESIPVKMEQPTAQKTPPPGETAESGHWHGDIWHTELHAGGQAHTHPPNILMRQLIRQMKETLSKERPNVSNPGATPLTEKLDVDRIKAKYEVLREKYPKQTNNPPRFENVPVDLQDFEATKEAFIDHLNFYRKHRGDTDEVFGKSREIRIAYAVMTSINNAVESHINRVIYLADTSLLSFTPEQCIEIRMMYERWRKSEGHISHHEKIMDERGVTYEEAVRISIYESLKAKGYSDEDIPAHYRDIGKQANENR